MASVMASMSGRAASSGRPVPGSVSRLCRRKKASSSMDDRLATACDRGL
jgi:hypothetical protein